MGSPHRVAAVTWPRDVSFIARTRGPRTHDRLLPPFLVALLPSPLPHVNTETRFHDAKGGEGGGGEENPKYHGEASREGGERGNEEERRGLAN